jgi:aspartate/methionine/tyrosine aminotransferase
MEARRWLADVTHPANRPLINVSQAAPVDPPPEAMRAAMAEMIMQDPESHLYGPVLGLPGLREEVAKQWSAAYGGAVSPEHVAITSGCNQAFAAAITSLCNEGDEVIIPLPYYFNHRMWLDMVGVKSVGLLTDPHMIPHADEAAKLITPRTKAIALVSPNNPAGVEYPAETLSDFYALAASRGIKLIVDETYRDFDSRDGAPHTLLQSDTWGETLIQLYSFSKAYRLTGHRVGAVITSPALLSEMEKFLDTVAICPNQLGQRSALWGMQNLKGWLAGERQEVLARRAAITNAFPRLAAKGWKLLGCGAYFAYVEHPFPMSSAQLAPKLVNDISVLALPGTMFMPDDVTQGQKQMRIAFANIDASGISQLFDRLENLTL